MLFCEVNGRCKSVISGGNFPHTIAFATNNSMINLKMMLLLEEQKKHRPTDAQAPDSQLCNFIFIYSQLNSYFNIIKDLFSHWFA